MKKYQKVLAISLLVLSIHQFSRADQSFEQIFQAAEPQAALENSEFPRYSTEQYLYAVSSVEQSVEQDAVVAPVIVSDKTVNNYFNNGKTRILITQEIKGGKLVTTTETWKTKNPSYLTKANGLLMARVLFAVGWIQFLKYWFAYHESAHALMQALTQKKLIVDYATIKVFDFSSLQFQNPHINSSPISSLGMFKEEALEYFDNAIMVDVSGGIGMELSVGADRSLEPDRFLNEWYTLFLGMSSFPLFEVGFVQETDMIHAHEHAQKYYNLKNDLPLDTPVDRQETDKIIKQCTKKASNILIAHRDKLDTLAKKVYWEETVYKKDIYEISEINIPKPNFIEKMKLNFFNRS